MPQSARPKCRQCPSSTPATGTGQHPTQALLDLYTIVREHGHIDGLTIGLAGDLKHGRTVRSLAYLLGKFEGVRIIFVSPPELKVGADIKEYLDRHGVLYAETQDIREAIGKVGVLYQTRIQKERFADPNEYERLKHCYRIDAALAGRCAKALSSCTPCPALMK